ncbi:MAG: DNA integrity scanning protein DisA nucleotide-binding domain protein [Ignavibacteria bacterium]|nr:DNA integrity scanning protein DisA nucleotide-binding domain protein [Ignavibacteria bacterium]
MGNSVNNTTESYYLWETQPACTFIIQQIADLLICQHLGISDYKLCFLVIPHDERYISRKFDIIKNTPPQGLSLNFWEQFNSETRRKNRESYKEEYIKIHTVEHYNHPNGLDSGTLQSYFQENTSESQEAEKELDKRTILRFKRDFVNEIINERRNEVPYHYNSSFPHTKSGNFNEGQQEFDIYIILGVNKNLIFDSLNTVFFFDYPSIGYNYVECVVNKFLELSYETLNERDLSFDNSIFKPIKPKNSGENYEYLIHRNSVNEITRKSAISMMQSVELFSRYEGNPDLLALSKLFYTCNAVVSLNYEGKSCDGEILFLNRKDINVLLKPNHKLAGFRVYLVFEKPIKISNLRQLRKLLEASGQEIKIVSDSEFLFGLVSLDDSVNFHQLRSIYRVKFSKQSQWELYDRINQKIMIVEHGIPSLPKPNTNTNDLNVALNNIFQNIDEQQEQKLGKLLSNLVNTKHGATLVITDQAQLEADRLGSSCIATVPRELEVSTITSISSIDGAILVDLDAQCYAIGVILDGLSNNNTDNNEDPARGSRYNSAIRYINTTENKTIVAVISVDGMVNILTKKSPPTSL